MKKNAIICLLIACFCLSSQGLIAEATTELVLDRFSAAVDNDGIPEGWRLKVSNGKPQLIKVEREEGNSVLHLKSKSSSFRLEKATNFDIKEYPVLNWRWKVAQLPQKGDVRDKERDDQAAQLYLSFCDWPRMKVRTNLLGYIWENLTPRKLTPTSLKWNRLKYLVLRNRDDTLGKWVSERQHVIQDYQRIFGKMPPPLIGIAIMIDADDTNSSAESYFDDIIFSRE